MTADDRSFPLVLARMWYASVRSALPCVVDPFACKVRRRFEEFAEPVTFASGLR